MSAYFAIHTEVLPINREKLNLVKVRPWIVPSLQYSQSSTFHIKIKPRRAHKAEVTFGAHMCVTLRSPPKVAGMGPDIWFWSIEILSSSDNFPSPGGRMPESLFPFNSLPKIMQEIQTTDHGHKSSLLEVKSASWTGVWEYVTTMD